MQRNKKLERIQAHKEKQKAGTARRVGTEQICPNCGKSFILKSGSQKICEECAKKRVYPKNSTVKPKDLYDIIHIYVPKGEKVKLQDWVKSKNLTLNKAYNMAMQLFMEQLDKEDTESNTLL